MVDKMPLWESKGERRKTLRGQRQQKRQLKKQQKRQLKMVQLPPATHKTHNKMEVQGEGEGEESQESQESQKGLLGGTTGRGVNRYSRIPLHLVQTHRRINFPRHLLRPTR